MYRIAIAGCGWAGERHFEAVRSDERAEVVAVAEADAAVRRGRVAEWGVETVTDFRDLWNFDLDAVVVALPHDLHREAVVEAVEAGVDVLCEKPVATSVADADAMIDAAEARDAAFVVAESARYDLTNRLVEEILGEGSVGHPLFAEWDWLHDFDSYGYPHREWLNDPDRAGGGQWLINGVHFVSVLRGWLAAAGGGDVESVYARASRSPEFDGPEGVEANLAATLGFDGGATATVRLASEVDDHDRFDTARVHGTRGTVEKNEGGTVSVYEGDTETRERVVGDADPFEAQMSHFLDCLAGEAAPRTPAVRERDTLAVVEAGYRSMESGEVEPVERRGDGRA